MSEERFVLVKTGLKEKRPYEKCPNCGEIEYREYKKQNINFPDGLKGELIWIAGILSLGLLIPILEIFVERGWEGKFKECSECHYRENIKND